MFGCGDVSGHVVASTGREVNMDALRSIRPSRPSDIVAGGWCQGHHAVNADGRPCPLVSPYAVAFDCLGAAMLGRVRGYDVGDKVLLLIDALPHDVSLNHWNDAPERNGIDVVMFLREYGL